MNIQIPANEYNALLANAADDVRYYLGGIYVDTEHDCLVATDGHALMRLPVTIQGERPEPFILARTKRAPVDGHVTITDIDVDAFTKSGIHKWTETISKIDGKFPDYVRVIPDGERSSLSEFNFNPKLIARTHNALRLAIPSVTLTRTGKTNDAFFVEFHAAEHIDLIVMPVRR